MKKILTFSFKTISAALISTFCAALFCATFSGFCAVSLFGGLFLALLFGVLD